MTGNGGRHSEQFRVMVKAEVCLLADLIVPEAVYLVRLGRAILQPANVAERLSRRIACVAVTAGASATVVGTDGLCLDEPVAPVAFGHSTLCAAVRAAAASKAGDRTRITFSGILGIGGSKHGVVERAPQRGVRSW